MLCYSTKHTPALSMATVQSLKLLSTHSIHTNPFPKSQSFTANPNFSVRSLAAAPKSSPQKSTDITSLENSPPKPKPKSSLVDSPEPSAPSSPSLLNSFSGLAGRLRCITMVHVVHCKWANSLTLLILRLLEFFDVLIAEMGLRLMSLVLKFCQLHCLLHWLSLLTPLRHSSIQLLLVI